MPSGMADGQRASAAASEEGIVSQGTHCTPIPRGQDRIAGGTWGCPAGSQMPISHVPGALMWDSHHHLTCPQSPAEQDGWDWGTRAGLRGTGWDRQLAEPHSSAPSLLHHPHVQPPHGSDPTAATKGRLKPRLDTAWLMAPEALEMNSQHCGTASHCSHPLQEGKRAAESLNCC